MSTTLKVGLGLAFLVLLSGFAYQMYERGDWEARARALAGQAARTDSLLRVSRQDSTIYAHSRDSLSQQAQAARFGAARASIAFKATLDSLKQQSRLLEAPAKPDSTPTLVQPFDTLTMLKVFAQRAYQGMLNAGIVIAARDSEIVDLHEVIRLDSIRIAGVSGLRDRLLAERDSSRALNHPPSPFALTFAVGVGPGCASNLAQTVCGVSIQATVFRFRIKG